MRTPLCSASLGLLLTACSGSPADTATTTDATDTSAESGTSFPSTGGASLPTSSEGPATSTGLTGSSTSATSSSGDTGSSTAGSSGDTGSSTAGSSDTGTDASSTGVASSGSSSSGDSGGSDSSSGTSSSSSGSGTSSSSGGGGPSCGDGVVEGDEACDDGVANDDSAACLEDCALASCGDGLVWVGEEACDDGNADETDACTKDCQAPSCGDGQKNGGETGVDCGGPACPACPMVLLLGGNATKLLGARYDGAAWTTAELAAPAVDPVDVAITSDGVGVGVFRYTKIGDPKDRQLQYVLYKDGAWTAPAAIGASLTRAAPTLSAAGKGAHLVFQGEDYQFYYAGYTGAAWSPTAEMIGSYGPGPGSVATLGADAVYVFHDGDKSNNVYSRTRAPVWQPQQLIDTQTSFNRPAVVIALGAVAELLAVHTLNATDQVRFSARKAGVWAATADLAGATTPHAPALAALPGGQAILALRGVDSRIYTSTYDAGADTWTPVTAVDPDPISDRPPAVAAGLAGAEVELVYLDAASKTPRHIRLNKGVWSAPVVVGATALDNVAVTRGP